MNKTFFDKSTLHPREERKLKALCNRKLIKALGFTLLWYAAVIAGWAYITVSMNRPVLDPGLIVYLALFVLPFYPFRVHRTLFGKSFYANVGAVRYTEDLKFVQRADMRRRRTIMRAYEREVLSVTFHGDNGEKMTVLYNEHNVRADGGYYKFGDRVLVLKGLKYPVKIPLPEDERIICPVCGLFIPKGERHCSWCNADFK